MAVKSPGDYLMGDGKEDGMGRTFPCLDTKRLDGGRHEEDDIKAMSEQHGPSLSVDDCGVSSEGKCGPKYLETSASQSEDEADGGACGDEKSLSPVLTTYPSQPGFTLKKAEDRNLYSALPSSDFSQPSIVPKTLHDETPQPLSIATKQQESAQDFLSTQENPYKNSVIGERARHDIYSDKLLRHVVPNPKEYSPVDFLTKSKNAEDETKIREHGTNAEAIGNPVKDAQERKVSVSSRGKAEEVLDTRSEMPKWLFKDEKEFQNWEPSCPDGDSRLLGQVRNKHRPTYEHYSFSIPKRGYHVFRFGESKKKYFHLATFIETKLEEEALACTEAKSHTEYDEGVDDNLHRTSKTLIKYSEGGLASNITKHTINESPQLLVGETQLPQKRENKPSGSGLVRYYNAGESLDSEDEEECLRHFQNKEEDEYLRLYQRKEKSSTKSGSLNTVSTRREQNSCVRQLEKEDASFQSDEIATQNIFPSTDHGDYDGEPKEDLQNKTLEQEQPATPEPVVICNYESAPGSDFGIGYNEYPCQSDQDADVITAPEEKNKYTNERNGDKSCIENRDTFYSQWPNQTVVKLLHQDQLNVRDEELASATCTTAGARNASDVPAILFPGGTDRDDRTFSAPLILANSHEAKDGSGKTVLSRDASLEIQPAPRNDSSDSQKNPGDDIVSFTDDDYTAAQSDATTNAMNAQSEHSVLPADNTTPALNENKEGVAAEHENGFVLIEDVESPSTRRFYESDLSNVDPDQHQGDNEDTSEKEHSAMNDMVVSVELTAHVSEHDLETRYNYDTSEHVSDGHQERKNQDNPAGFELDSEVKAKSAEVRTAEGDELECDKHYAMIQPRLYEFGDTSNADFQEENDNNRTHDMPASFGATSVPSNTSAPASIGTDLKVRNFHICSDNYLEINDDCEGLPADQHELLIHQRSPSSSIKPNMQEIDIHSNSNQGCQPRSSESPLDPKLLTRREIFQEHFGPEHHFSYDEQTSAKKKHFKSFEEKLLLWLEARLSTVEVPRDKCGVYQIVGSHSMSYLIPSSRDIVVCPAKRDNTQDPPDPASDDENSEGPQDEDDLVEDGPHNENQLPPPGIPASIRAPDHQGIARREDAHGRVFAGEDHIGHGARNDSQLPRPGDPNASLGQSDRQEIAGREGEPRRTVICLDLVEPGARGEHQPPRLGIPCPFLRQTDRQGTAGREREPGGAVICVDRVERGARGERRLPNRSIPYTAHPCCCPRCLLIHLMPNIGLPAVEVPCPTECRGDIASDNDVHTGITPQVPSLHSCTAVERSSRPCDVSRLPQVARRNLCPGSTCRGHRTQENADCLDCLGVHFRQHENIRVEQQPCSHENSSTQSTVEEVDIAVHDRERLHHGFVGPEHGLCVMCGRHTVNTKLHNCLHQVVCRRCARFVRECPMCRNPVVGFSVL